MGRTIARSKWSLRDRLVAPRRDKILAMAIAKHPSWEFTNLMPSMRDIQRYCDTIADTFKPQRIILFGSHAYGTPTSDSDVDLLVVMRKARRLWMHTAQKIHETVSAGFPVDVLVRDPDFLRERLREGDCFLEEITSKGRVMYEGSHS
jgi:predicted nucleotidyltransferase